MNEEEGNEWKFPSMQVLVELASILVHLEELSKEGRKLDLEIIKHSLERIRPWLDSVPEVLKPVLRSEK